VKKSEDKPDFEVIFKSCPGLYLILDTQFTIIAASQAYLEATLTNKEDAFNKNIFDVFPDDPNDPNDPNANGASLLRASLQSVLVHKKKNIMALQKYDIRNAKNFFEERYWSPINYPVFDSNENIKYILHCVVDVTESVKLKKENILNFQISTNGNSENYHFEKVRQSQRMEAMGQLAGGVAHDFNNILATITLTSEMLLGNSNLPEFAKSGLKTILKGSESATSLTRQLLSFSRKQTLQPKVLNINKILTQMKVLLYRTISEDLELKLELAENLRNTLVDYGQIEQIVMNLVVNARDALSSGGQITIKTADVTLTKLMSHGHMKVEPGNYVMLSVQDNGIGMDATTQARIFEPFFTTKEIGRGTGLGLATVYGIVYQNKGTIWVYSEPNRGSTFKIYFPVSYENLSDETLTEELPSIKSSQKRTILLVEDEEYLRNSISNVLRNVGYDVIAVENGLKAFEFIQNRTQIVDLIITDIIMPEMTGTLLAQKLNENQFPGKILFLSGYAENILESLPNEARPNFLEKPFGMKILLSKIASILNEL
jgi:signal transduction histidine kinase